MPITDKLTQDDIGVFCLRWLAPYHRRYFYPLKMLTLRVLDLLSDGLIESFCLFYIDYLTNSSLERVG